MKGSKGQPAAILFVLTAIVFVLCFSAEAQQPKARADKLVRTHHAQAKDKPKARQEPKEARASKGHQPSRAEKHATKAAALEAAKRATRKSAKT